MVYNTEAHIRITELLLLHGNWNEKLPGFASAPQLPPRKVSRPQFPVLDQFMGFDEETANLERQPTEKEQSIHR